MSEVPDDRRNICYTKKDETFWDLSPRPTGAINVPPNLTVELVHVCNIGHAYMCVIVKILDDSRAHIILVSIYFVRYAYLIGN